MKKIINGPAVVKFFPQGKALVKSKANAAKSLAKMMPYKKWCAATHPTESQKKMYRKIKKGLKKLAREGSILRISGLTETNTTGIDN